MMFDPFAAAAASLCLLPALFYDRLLLSFQIICSLHIRRTQSKCERIHFKGCTDISYLLTSAEPHMIADGKGLLPAQPHKACDNIDALFAMTIRQPVFTTYYNSLSRLDAARGQGIGLVIPDNPDKWFVSIGDLATATNGSTQWERTTVSFLGRVIYNYKGKYLFNGSFRRDGSSAFSYTGNQWQNFYSAGAGWLMTEVRAGKRIGRGIFPE